MSPKKQVKPTRTRRVRCQHCNSLKERSGLKKHEAHCSMRGQNVVDENSVITRVSRWTPAKTDGAKTAGQRLNEQVNFVEPETYPAYQYHDLQSKHKFEILKLEQVIEKQKRSISAMRQSMHLLFRSVAEGMEIINE